MKEAAYMMKLKLKLIRFIKKITVFTEISSQYFQQILQLIFLYVLVTAKINLKSSHRISRSLIVNKGNKIEILDFIRNLLELKIKQWKLIMKSWSRHLRTSLIKRR